ncbi:MAG: hypothetical protein JNM56_33715 [Planctomycetia bacterium]|nr:hypothetical protein [Planctomycetia bacterium]
MTPNQAVVQDTLKADGTLEPDQKPNLPTGPVEVTIRATAVAPVNPENWWEFLQRARKELEAGGRRFMNDAEVAAYVEEL